MNEETIEVYCTDEAWEEFFKSLNDFNNQKRVGR